jgi:hypothetical protein
MPKKDLIRLPVKGRRPLSFAVSDLPDGTRKYVFDQTDPSLTLGQFDARKIKGVDLTDPSIEATIPMSVENPALAYDATNDEFYVRSKSTSRPIYADLRTLVGAAISKTNPLNVRLADGTDNIPFPTALDTGAFKTREQNPITGFATAANQIIIQAYIDGIETLLAGGLPAALDTGALKTREQNPITGFATQTTLALIAGYVDGLETLLGGGLPAALDTGALKTREQNPITGFATQTTLALIAGYVDGLETLLGGGLPAALDTGALKIREQGTPTVTVGTFPDNEPFNLNQVGGTAQTAADWTPLLQKLDAALSTMARLQPWYQTNFTRDNRGYSAALIAPHGFTNRWTYTIPASRIGRVMMAEVELMRDAAPVAAGTAYCYITVGAVFGPDMREITATVGVPRALFTSEGTIAIADDVITSTTADGSNGGTYTYVSCANIMVFNT